MRIGRRPKESAERPAKSGPKRSSWRRRLALGYLALVTVLSLLARIYAERYWWSALLLLAPQSLYLAPLFPLALWAAWKRDRRALLVHAVTLALVAGPLMGFNIPSRFSAPPAGRPRVRLLAYNIADGAAGLEVVGAQARRFNPDVVVLCETRDWGGKRDLRTRLPQLFPGWSSVRAGDLFIASRWPLADWRAEPLVGIHDRQKVRARVAAPFGDFYVVGIHIFKALPLGQLLKSPADLPDRLRTSSAWRAAQSAEVLQWTRDLSGPVLMAGDFNTPPRGLFYGQLAGRFQDAFRERGWGWGYTFPSRFPVLRIDYVFHSAQWEVARCEVGPAPGSDHRPVFAELVLRP